MARSQSSSSEPSPATAVAEVSNGFSDLRFDSPLLSLVQQALGPFVAHKDGCEVSGGECTCGLAAAIANLQQREILFKRYGTVDG